MPRIYTEIRIEHKTLEDKKAFEEALDKALRASHYNSRPEWIREKARELIDKKKSE